MTESFSIDDHILEQGQALVRALEALETIEPTGPIKRVQACKRQLRQFGKRE